MSYANMNLKQLKELVSDFRVEVTTLESLGKLTKSEEDRLTAKKNSLNVATRELTKRGGPTATDSISGLPGTSDKYQTMKTVDGDPVYAVGTGQRFVDIPGVKASKNPNALGEMCHALLTGSKSGVSAEVKMALDEATGSGGGYNVPSELSASVIDLARANSVLTQSGMQTLNLTTDGMMIATVESDPEVALKLENDKFAESSMSFGAVEIVPRMVGCLIRCSREVIEDAPNFPALITQTISRAFAASIDRYGIQGLAGQQTPRGLLSFDEIPSRDLTGAQVSWESCASAALDVKRRNHMPSTMMTHTDIQHQLEMSKDTQNRWLGPPPTMANTSRISSTQVPENKIVLGDFSNFALGLRSGFRLDFTDVGAEAFERHQRVFRVYWRGDYAVLDPSAFQVLTIKGPAIIISQPLSQTVAVGDAVVMSVVAAGKDPLTYQWQKDGADITGETSSVLSIAAATAGDAGDYRAIVTNELGSVTSDVATLAVV